MWHPADHLHKRFRKGDSPLRPLSWEKRLKICIGAARGLDYLHTGTSAQQRVIHRDVKSSNILLDDNMEAKVSDFGLSKVGPANQAFSTYVSTHIKGTPGYLDPYYFATHRLTRKSDVYSFGVVLFEVLGGRPAVDGRLDEERRGLAGWAQHCFKEGLLDEIIDPRIKGKILSNSLDAFVKIAIQCLQTGPKQRPTMAEVVVGLESALALQERGTTYTLPEIPLTNSDLNHVTNQMNSHSPLVEGLVNVAYEGLHDEKSPAKMKFTKKVGLFLLGTTRMFSVHKDGMPSGNKRNNNSRIPMVFEEGVIQDATSKLKEFKFAELSSATSKFSRDNILGEGGFGKVFKGWVLENTYAPSKTGIGMGIAVKRLRLDSMQGFLEWKTEIKFLGKYSHPNLVKLLGYCDEDNELLLVYEYMQNGSLYNHIFNRPKGSKQLSWPVRLKVLTGAARCLAFFHTADEQVTLRSVKTSDILLDSEFNAKISDVGMAKLGPINDDTHITTRIMGTYGYAAPEYVATGHLGVKCDVYSFGVVFLELFTGKRVIDSTRNHEKVNLVDWARPFLSHEHRVRRIVDPSLLDDFLKSEKLSVVSSLILKCLSDLPKNRPSMVQVLETLEALVP